MNEEDRTTPERVEVSASTGLRITWSDGHVSVFDLLSVRGACGCATCHELRAAGRPVFLGRADDLDVERAELAGAYGIVFHWSDGHATGIYTWDDLREGCPCDECRVERRVLGRPNPLDR